MLFHVVPHVPVFGLLSPPGRAAIAEPRAPRLQPHCQSAATGPVHRPARPASLSPEYPRLRGADYQGQRRNQAEQYGWNHLAALAADRTRAAAPTRREQPPSRYINPSSHGLIPPQRTTGPRPDVRVAPLRSRHAGSDILLDVILFLYNAHCNTAASPNCRQAICAPAPRPQTEQVSFPFSSAYLLRRFNPSLLTSAVQAHPHTAGTLRRTPQR